MSDAIRIREIGESDFASLLELFSEFAAFEKLPEKMENSIDRMGLEKDYFHGFVALTADDRIVGYATYFFCYFTWIGKSLYMDDLYVRPQFRGKGLGTLLIRKVISMAAVSGCHKLSWQVSAWNKPAIAFYKSLGAEIDGTEQNCVLALDGLKVADV